MNRQQHKRLAIVFTLLLGMFNAKALPCDYRVTSAISEYSLEVLHVDAVVECGHAYNVISDHAKCSFSYDELKVESTSVTQWLLTPSTMTKIDKCVGGK